MIKVLLLNRGGYGLEETKFPVEVLAERIEQEDGFVFILGSELIRIGGKLTNEEDCEGFDPTFPYCFFLDTEVEKVDVVE